MITKSSLAVNLSKIPVFREANPKLEQYPTDSEIAAESLWQAYMLGDIEDRTITDAGCGTGILGIGCLMLGAGEVNFIDNDKEAMKLAEKNIKENINEGAYDLINEDIKEFSSPSDVIIQNPPFGSKNRHADKEFLEKAFKLSNVIYSFHIYETKDFLERLAEDKGFRITHIWRYKFPLKKTMKFHSKRIKRIDVGCFRFEKIK
ncbi:MAG: METTL5 family protein [Nanobdellota archaeon]